MKLDLLRSVLTKRINLHLEDPVIMDCWEKEAEILSENVSETIEFFKHECTDEELAWLCEVFDTVIEKTQSSELISVWENRLQGIQDDEDRKNIETDILFAKNKLDLK